MGDRLTAGAPFTGRVNLFATEPGLAVVDRDRLNRINLVDESITIATLDEFAPVHPKQMVATIKIIPFAAPEQALRTCEAIAVPPDLGPRSEERRVGNEIDSKCRTRWEPYP